MPPAVAPVFVFTVHRSGGTLLGRLLNAHPQLVIWGEHGGIINNLADLELTMLHSPQEGRHPLPPAQLARIIEDPAVRAGEFGPWRSPGRMLNTRDHAKAMILDLFASGLAPGQRWGFKEIRYHRPLVAKYLSALFPGAQFILLQRDTIDCAVSCILAEWSLDGMEVAADGLTPEILDAVVRDVLYALLAIAHGFREVTTVAGERCFNLHYNVLKNRDIAALMRMFAFLELETPPALPAWLETIFDYKVHPTDKQPRFAGQLTAERIRARAAALLPGLRAEIAADGINRARLLSRRGVGKFSYMAGDHPMRGSPLSGLF